MDTQPQLLRHDLTHNPPDRLAIASPRSNTPRLPQLRPELSRSWRWLALQSKPPEPPGGQISKTSVVWMLPLHGKTMHRHGFANGYAGYSTGGQQTFHIEPHKCALHPRGNTHRCADMASLQVSAAFNTCAATTSPTTHQNRPSRRYCSCLPLPVLVGLPRRRGPCFNPRSLYRCARFPARDGTLLRPQ